MSAFYFEASGASVRIALVDVGTNLPEITLQKSSDGSSWRTWDRSPIVLNPGERLYLMRGIAGNDALSRDESNYRHFTIEPVVPEEGEPIATCACGGDVLELTSPYRDLSPYGFARLFENCARLTSAPYFSNPFMLEEGCYYAMFRGCSGITSAPSLEHVAYIKGKSCCAYMFANCTRLTGEVLLPVGDNWGFGLSESCYEGMFSNCPGITSVNRLSIGEDERKLPYRCFYNMFSGCAGLTDDLFVGNAPAISFRSVAELSESCCAYMFSGCTGLSRIPEMPSVALAPRCYDGMFSFCSGITSISGFRLPATLTAGCCRDMFYGCTALQSAGIDANLFASVTKLASECCQNMFSACAGLTAIPHLPGYGDSSFALADLCFAYMFSNCSGLESTNGFTVATHLKDGCYSGMFSGCTSLSTAPSLGDVSEFAPACFSEMFSGCTGILALPEFPSAMTLTPYCFDRMFSRSGIKSVSSLRLPATMRESCCREMFRGCADLDTLGAGNLFASVATLARDCFNGMFRDCQANTVAQRIPPSAFAESCCAYMYAGNANLTTASSLSATSLAEQCCLYMFKDCVALENAPALPDASVRRLCYAHMFEGCTHLTGVPSLSATTLDVACYQNMFAGCTELKTTPALPATTLPQSCYRSMFSGCTGLGTDEDHPDAIGTVAAFASDGAIGYGSCYGMFYKCTGLKHAPALEAMSLDDYCYAYMFYGCTGLTASPQIKATTLHDYCCSYMFSGCTGLQSMGDVSVVLTESGVLAPYCCYYMFSGCTRLNIASRDIKTNTLAPYCFYAMFYGCTGLVNTIDPAFNVKRLAEGCCAYMYAGCTRLQEVYFFRLPTAKACFSHMYSNCTGIQWIHGDNFGETISESCYAYMFAGCTSLRSVEELTATLLAPSCYEGMFRGCQQIRKTTDLPATELKERCYANMYADCTGLELVNSIRALELSDGVLAAFCCSGMFQNCVKLTEIPDLRPTAVAESCYAYMFAGCTSLRSVDAHLLPATTLSASCYSGMFRGCWGLTDFIADRGTWSFSAQAPSGYHFGIIKCTDIDNADYALVKVPNDYTGGLECSDWWYFDSNDLYIDTQSAAKDATNIEFDGIAPRVSAKYPSDIYDRTEGWSFDPGPSEGHAYVVYHDKVLPTSGLFGCTLIDVDTEAGTASVIATGNATRNPDPTWYHDEVYRRIEFRTGTYEKIVATNSNSDWQIDKWTFSPDAASGSQYRVATIRSSMIYYDFKSYLLEVTGWWNVRVLASTVHSGFDHSVDFTLERPKVIATRSAVIKTSAITLPAESVAPGCYASMFDGCSGMKDVPSLPAGNLAQAPSCYAGMFEGCSGIVTIADSSSEPALPATQIGASCYARMFFGCTSLSTAPHLPCANLAQAESCYAQMFESCTLLSSVPQIAATRLGKLCYARMFAGCTRLTDASGANLASVVALAESCCEQMFAGCTNWQFRTTPALPSGISAESCYAGMFDGCTALTQITSLPSSAPAASCYEQMFAGCTALTAAPNLTATVLTNGCYRRMFAGCTALRNMPAIAATELAPGCCEGMFDGCTALQGVSALSAPNMADSCYRRMFAGCTALTSSSGAGLASVEELADSCFYEMFADCVEMTAATGLPGDGVPLEPSCYERMFAGCVKLAAPPQLRATALTRSCYREMFKGCADLALTGSFTLQAVVIAEMCYEGMFDGCAGAGFDSAAEVLPYDAASGESLITAVERACFRNMFARCSSLETPPVLPGGGVVMLDSCCESMFEDCTSLTFAPSLPSTMLGKNCYHGMFNGCTAMTAAMSVLPATELADGCYNAMFRDCAALLSIPDLPATTLAKNCYHSMFMGCASLAAGGSGSSDSGSSDSGSSDSGSSVAFVLPATELADGCYDSMFSGCAVLRVAPDLPASVMRKNCYRNMFYGCAELEYAPALNAMSLAYGCYQNMFSGCKRLANAPDLPATEMAENCYYQMFLSCSDAAFTDASNVLPKNPNGTSAIIRVARNCFNSMFANCANLVSPPVIPGVQMAENSCRQMFYYCKSLVLPAGYTLPATQLAKSCYQRMFIGCASIDVPPVSLPADEAPDSCYYQMFSGCTILGSAPEIRATSFGSNSCYQMFRDCKALEDTPAIHAQDVAASGFRQMFANCTALEHAFLSVSDSVGVTGCENMFSNCPALQQFVGLLDAQTLARQCYHEMFKETALTAPVPLPATDLTEAPFCYQAMFAGCASLRLPIGYVLPATVLSEGCYTDMFRSCAFDSAANLLPVIAGESTIQTLAKNCFQRMFYGCANLATPPQLPGAGVALAEGCYEQMFAQTGLTAAPTLHATTLAKNCYSGMFYACRSLETVPTLPDATLAEGCYQEMFAQTNLAAPVALPATTLAKNCYSGMFSYCTNLVVPDDYVLPAVQMAEGCYQQMFSACTNASFISVGVLPTNPDDISASALEALAVNCFAGMFSGCSHLAAHPILPGVGVALAEGCYQDMFRNTALASPIRLPATTLAKNCYNGMFASCNSLTVPSDYFLPATQMAEGCYQDMFKACTNVAFTSASARILPIRENGTSTITKLAPYCFSGMFNSCSHLEYPPTLPLFSVALAEGCYQEMFMSTALAAPVSLAATTLAKNCYKGMFASCRSLVIQGNYVLPATEMDEGCYSEMFQYCNNDQFTSAASVLIKKSDGTSAITSLAPYCFQSMFRNCSRLVTPPVIPGGVMKEGCYQEMFYGTALTEPVRLPSFQLAPSCYRMMFSDCGSLVIPSTYRLPAAQMAESCYQQMFAYCTNANFTSAANILTSGSASVVTVLAPSCFSGMFTYSTRLTTPPKLPGSNVELKESCYQNMFSYTGLTAPASLPATTLARNCYYRMFYGCNSIAIPNTYRLPATRMAEYCYCEMFGSCGGALTSARDIFVKNTDGTSTIVELAPSCFAGMFMYSPYLTTPPALPGPSVALADRCYAEMFYGCYALESAPELHAAQLAMQCYEGMFYNCKKLTGTVGGGHPFIRATESAPSALRNMFYGCESLYAIRIGFDRDPSNNPDYSNWTSGVPKFGTLIVPEGSSVSRMVPADWRIVAGEPVHPEESAVEDIRFVSVGYYREHTPQYIHHRGESAAKDATHLAELLENWGYVGQTFTQTNATCAAVTQQLRDYVQDATEDSLIIFAFSGDCGPSSLELSDGAIDMDEIVEIVESCPGRVFLIANGPILDGRTIGNDRKVLCWSTNESLYHDSRGDYMSPFYESIFSDINSSRIYYHQFAVAEKEIVNRREVSGQVVIRTNPNGNFDENARIFR